MNYDLFKFRWTVLGSMMMGVGGALSAGELSPLARAAGAMLAAGGAAITAFFHKSEMGNGKSEIGIEEAIAAGGVTPGGPSASARTPGTSDVGMPVGQSATAGTPGTSDVGTPGTSDEAVA